MKEDTELDRHKLAKRWDIELDIARKHSQKYIDRAKKINKRYRDERDSIRDSEKKFNVLWSNVQTMRPAVYAKIPKPEVTRRFGDRDPVERTAATMLERCLEYEVEQYPDYHSAMHNALTDRLIVGRGVAWVRYDPSIDTVQSQTTDDTEGYEEISKECAPSDYVAWEDFNHQPARTWEEVDWVSRDVYMGLDELKKRFGELGDEIDKIPLSHKPAAYKDNEKVPPEGSHLEKARITEIWCKSEDYAVWVADGYDRSLDVKRNPLQLDGFFPCPKPLFATLTTDSLLPVPDYCQYEDQAKELDTLTQRISLITKAVKVAGVYDATQSGIKNLLSTNVENTLVPVDSWSMFAEKGGLKGAVDFLPLGEIIETLKALYEARDSVIETIYQITGLADIVRGSTKASETATAQNIKARFASVRIQELQNDIARFASDLLKLKAEIICQFYQPETIIEMSGVMHTLDAERAVDAVKLLKTEPVRTYRIQVESDSMVDLDIEQEKRDRVEFLTAVGSYFKEAIPLAQMAPEVQPLLGELLRFGVRGFKAGRDVEAAFDSFIEQQGQQQQIPPEVTQKMQEVEQREQAIAQAEVEFNKQAEDMRYERVKLDKDKEIFNIREQSKRELESMAAQAERNQSANVKELTAMRENSLNETGSVIQQALGQFGQIADSLNAATQGLAAILEEMQAHAQKLEELQIAQAEVLRMVSAKRVLVRDANGRPVASQIEAPDTIQ